MSNNTPLKYVLIYGYAADMASTTFTTAKDAAYAFWHAAPNHRPALIRADSSGASIPGQTHFIEEDGQRTYWKNLGGFDKDLLREYGLLSLPVGPGLDACMASEKFSDIDRKLSD